MTVHVCRESDLKSFYGYEDIAAHYIVKLPIWECKVCRAVFLPDGPYTDTAQDTP